jgi:hypothetical protein
MGRGYALARWLFGKGWCCLPSHRPPSGLSHRVKGPVLVRVCLAWPLDTA